MPIPEPLRSALDELARTPTLLVASDFDGTLAPFVDDPADAAPLPAAATALAELATLAGTEVALVSGRELAVLRSLAGAPAAVHLVGSHGAEFDDGFAEPVDTELLGRMTAALRDIARDRPGVTVETKPASVALHVRRAAPPDGEAALTAARDAAAGWAAHATAGKAVLEFAVLATDKGVAVDTLRDRVGATAVIFLGDDVTDENALRRLRPGDVGVKVGAGETAAAFRVEDPAAVAETLAHLVRARAAQVPGSGPASGS